MVDVKSGRGCNLWYAAWLGGAYFGTPSASSYIAFTKTALQAHSPLISLEEDGTMRAVHEAAKQTCTATVGTRISYTLNPGSLQVGGQGFLASVSPVGS